MSNGPTNLCQGDDDHAEHFYSTNLGIAKKGPDHFVERNELMLADYSGYGFYQVGCGKIVPRFYIDGINESGFCNNPMKGVWI